MSDRAFPLAFGSQIILTQRATLVNVNFVPPVRCSSIYNDRVIFDYLWQFSRRLPNGASTSRRILSFSGDPLLFITLIRSRLER